MKFLFNKPAVEKSIESCIKNTFNGDDWTKVNNTVLFKERRHMQKVGLYWFPSISINKIRYLGKLDKISLFNAICSKFKDPPKECSFDVRSKNINEWNKTKFIEDKVNKEVKENSGLSKWAIAVIIIICLIVSIITFLIYRRYLKRHIKKQIDMQTSEAVSNYFALRDDEPVDKINTKM